MGYYLDSHRPLGHLFGKKGDMNRERIAKMTNNIVGAVTAEEVDNVHIASVAGDEDALAMVEQALDSMIAASQVIDEYLPRIKPDDVPQRAAIDAVKDLMDTGVNPYLADVVTAMKTLGD